ncbi:hypothetical protein FRX31_027999 [Thalictrum thalictroides]|uniref:Uncharacterized protein n=1 Tax=Thalictrum thalictroides TaxID=46969 RepID=A0A7J6VBZ9_THATH|nr:hypothetical protein FRX31_027999 [Thalictrum thalictroides]
MEGYYQQPNSIDPSMVETLNRKAKMSEKGGHVIAKRCPTTAEYGSPRSNLGLNGEKKENGHTNSNANRNPSSAEHGSSCSSLGLKRGFPSPVWSVQQEDESGNPSTKFSNQSTREKAETVIKEPSVRDGTLIHVGLEDHLAAEYKENNDQDRLASNPITGLAASKGKGIAKGTTTGLWAEIAGAEFNGCVARKKPICVAEENANKGVAFGSFGASHSDEFSAQMEQFRINSELGSYGLHSPTKKAANNESLATLLQSSLHHSGQEDIQANNVQQEKTPIQFGSFKGASNQKSWDGMMGRNPDGKKLSYIPPMLVNG